MMKHHLENDLIQEKVISKEEVQNQLLGGAENKDIVTLEKWDKIRDYEIT